MTTNPEQFPELPLNPRTPARRRSLQNMRRGALALLVLALLLFILSASRDFQGIWAWTGAFAEAAMVGGLADWFAVVALFRHPLGLPIPHTAILPRNKARLAKRLSGFIRDHFLESEAIVRLLRRADPAAWLAQWLVQPESSELLARQLLTLLQKALALSDDAELRKALRGALGRQLQRVDGARWIGSILALLTEDHRHQALLDDGIQRLRQWLDGEDTRSLLAEHIAAILKRAYPTLFAWMSTLMDPATLSDNLARNLVKAAHQLLQEIEDDPEHPRRLAFDRWMAEAIQRLQTDGPFQERIRRWQQGLIAHPAVQEYADGVLRDLRAWLDRDLQRPDSRLQHQVQELAAQLGVFLGGQAVLREAINTYLESSVRRLAPAVRDGLAQHIEKTILDWPEKDLIRLLEEGVGTDLQYIRVNGTLVGGLVGVLIHALALAVPLLI
ncbi:DUF445 domain-containing protein [Acidithiobacillus montserratensis]|uniref:DUF445 domain-containing protein n=1 Tax=Acidithiobacillus montserratensis TaxID=2729135 RepID=A0ACD5HHE9_9PROT|nr:DUF445 domain-containing protein [Acidithiobacillus montserratensis]MBN2680192.1 DUF445 domain-containing protein [Acidithiobacillaceae bacterium]MBU2748966.1 DUF445 domain-containing protein [Acidithiobacillus montserratensis]